MMTAVAALNMAMKLVAASNQYESSGSNLLARHGCRLDFICMSNSRGRHPYDRF